MESITVHKIITYSDNFYFVDHIGESHTPFCNCENYYVLSELDPQREIKNIDILFTIKEIDFIISFSKDIIVGSLILSCNFCSF